MAQMIATMGLDMQKTMGLLFMTEWKGLKGRG